MKTCCEEKYRGISVRRTRYKVQPYVKEAGNEGHDDVGLDDVGLDDEGYDDEGLDVEGCDDAQPMVAEAREHQHHAPGVQELPPA